MTCVQNSEVPSGEGLGTGLTGTPATTGSTTIGCGSTSGFSGTGLVLFMSVQSARLAVVPPINGKRRDWFKVKNLDPIEGQGRRAPGWPRPGAPRCQSCLSGSTCHRVTSPNLLTQQEPAIGRRH